MNIRKEIFVTTQKGEKHPIHIGSGILSQIGTVWRANKFGQKVVIITNPIVKKLYSDKVLQSLKKENLAVHILTVPDGEASKNMDIASKLLDQILKFRLDRTDTVIALGGGVIGDLAGFVASIYLRGINLIQVPTTLLAQVDSAVGGKTAVNHKKGKNLIGTFYQPNLTYIDLDTLITLKPQEVICGLAEIVKYGIICNKKLFWFMEKHQDLINRQDFVCDRKIWEYMIQRACINKAKVVSKDEKEAGLREILNFGHTIGHGIEAVFEYKKYLHGQAVALGMRAAILIAYKMKMIDGKLEKRINSLLTNLNFPEKIKGVDAIKIQEKLILDKKVRNNKIRFVLPTSLGEVVVRDDVAKNIVETVLKELTGK